MTTEFNSNLNLGSIPQVNAQKGIEKEVAPAPSAAAEVKETASKELPVGQDAIAGKSQIKADNVANDLVAFCSNPKAVELSDKFFDKAYAQLLAQKDPNAYEKACLLTSQFVAECTK